MRFTCEVIVPSSTTRFASRMRPSRSFTWPGNFASVCTIQNSVSVSPTGLSFHDAVKRFASGAEGAHVVTVLPERVGVVGADCGVVFDDGDAAGHGVDDRRARPSRKGIRGRRRL